MIFMSILAEMWWCGDEHCDCTQPQINERNERGHLIRTLEEGRYCCEADNQEHKEQCLWLLQKAREYQVENLKKIEEQYKELEETK